MDKHCFVLPSNLTVSFVNNPLIHLVVGLYKFDVIWLFIVLNVIKINFIPIKIKTIKVMCLKKINDRFNKLFS